MDFLKGSFLLNFKEIEWRIYSFEIATFLYLNAKNENVFLSFL